MPLETTAMPSSSALKFVFAIACVGSTLVYFSGLTFFGRPLFFERKSVLSRLHPSLLPAWVPTSFQAVDKDGNFMIADLSRNMCAIIERCPGVPASAIPFAVPGFSNNYRAAILFADPAAASGLSQYTKVDAGQDVIVFVSCNGAAKSLPLPQASVASVFFRLADGAAAGMSFTSQWDSVP